MGKLGRSWGVLVSICKRHEPRAVNRANRFPWSSSTLRALLATVCQYEQTTSASAVQFDFDDASHDGEVAMKISDNCITYPQ
jgi:hypothetical protein